MEYTPLDQNRIINFNKEYRYQIYASETEKQRQLFSPASIKMMSEQITYFLQGVHPEGKNIIVPNSTIISVADSFYDKEVAHLDVLQRMVVKYIVGIIKEQYETINKNNKLSIWITKYDVESGMTKTNGIKLNNKRRAPYMAWTY